MFAVSAQISQKLMLIPVAKLSRGVMSGTPLSDISNLWLRMPWVAGGVHWILKLPLKLSITIFYLSTFKGVKFKVLIYITLILGGSAAVIGMVSSFIFAA